MPLIDLKTDLKNLGYGSDKPYVTKDINNPPKYNSVSKEVTARVDDVTRVTKMFASANGIKFVAHEALLNSEGTGDRIKKSRAQGKTLAGAILKEAGRVAVNSGKTVASLIAQTGVAGTGQHIIRGFVPAEVYLDGGTPEATIKSLIGNVLPAALGDLDPQLTSSVLSIAGTDIIQDNRGEGYRSPIESGLINRESADGPVEPVPYTGHTGKTDTSVSSVNSVLKAQAQEVNSADTFTGYVGVENTSVNNVTSKLESNKSTLQPSEDLANTKAPSSSSLLNQEQTVSSIPRYGYTIPQQGGDGTVEIIRSADLDSEGNPILTVSRDFSPNSPSKLKSYLDQMPIDGSDTMLPSFADDPTLATAQDPTFRGLNNRGDVLTQTDGKGGRNTRIIDFRRVRKAGLNQGTSKYTGVQKNDHENGYASKQSGFWDVTQDSIETKFGVGSPGIIRASYDQADRNDTWQELRQDKINLLSVNEAPDGFSDIIPFKITSVIPGASAVTDTNLYFRAYLDDLSDNFNASWSSYKYVGRGDNIYAYDGFEREISFGFKAAAMSRDELSPIYDKLNYLASMTAPTYADSRFMRGTYARVTIGDYVSDLPGVITSVGFKWDTNVPWEIGTQSYWQDSNGKYFYDDTDLLRVPHMLNVSVSMKVIHDFTPTTTSDYRYIGYKK